MSFTDSRPRPQGPLGSTRRSAGFTLIELMIAVAIIAILASIAYPSYQSYVKSARVTDGKAALMEVAGRLERCYTADYSYASCFEEDEFPVLSDKKYYKLTKDNLDVDPSNSFVARVTVNEEEVADSQVECQWLEIDNVGNRDSDNDCW